MAADMLSAETRALIADALPTKRRVIPNGVSGEPPSAYTRMRDAAAGTPVSAAWNTAGRVTCGHVVSKAVRERREQVLAMARERRSTEAIAAEFGVSVRTIRIDIVALRTAGEKFPERAAGWPKRIA